LTNSVNEMWIKFYDPIAKQTQSVALQALGSVQAQGVVVSDYKDFTGIATPDLAARVCQRELAGSTVPLKRLQIKFKRSAYLLVPGGLFVLNMPAVSLSSVIFRVGEVDTGTLLDGAISVTAVQDVYSMPADTYVAVQTTGWVAPNNHPVAPTQVAPYEIDFRSLYMLAGSATALNVEAPTAYDGVLIGRPDPLCQNYALATKVGAAAYFAHSTDQFSPFGSLAAGIGAFDLSMTLTTATDTSMIPARVPLAAWIIDGAHSELVNVTAFTVSSGIATIARGCVDTVAWPHSAAVQVFFVDGFIGSDAIVYAAAETVDNIPLPNAPLGQLLIGSGIDVPVTLVGRVNFPYPPAMPLINGTRYDLVGTVTGPFVLSWVERNRLTQADNLIDQTMGTVTPEAGTTYTVRVYSSAPLLLQTFAGLTATSVGINSGASDTLTIELEAHRGGLTSFQTWAFPVVFVNDSLAMTDESGTQLDTETNVDIWSE
jgi:hypothetical protein